MAYTKTIHGFVEQHYNDEGACVSQEFRVMENQPVERRYILPDWIDEQDLEEDELGDDELIEDPDLLAELEATEKHFPTEMLQPKTQKTAKKRAA
jgi:hypothetical protein